ncbi:MAG: DUF4062 domain-containing protein [Pseudomonadota bacterium]
MTEHKLYPGVMVSSTFTDLKEQRQTLLKAIAKFQLMPIGMENDGARGDVDVIGSSLDFVRDAAAYIGVIGHKYGQTPECPTSNPDELSITELEFNEAMRLGRPILLFLMADDHPVTRADVERDPAKIEKLERFIERAKAMREGSPVHRVYEMFSSAEDFASRAGIAVGRLAELLKKEPDPETPDSDADEPARAETTLPNPPDLRAVPSYLGSHDFIGRASELETLDAWASEADPNPMLLFEAIGGSGKSMLTWEWVNNRATVARDDWAGRFWYSFYERGAQMVDFCREALAYITGQPVEDFSKLHIRDLSERLIPALERRPWLLVLDGLERVLVAYNRSDAAQLRDEEADTPEDQIANRDPCAAIRPEDDDLLRMLAGVSLSKILVTSRLTPRALINPSGMPVPGVRREMLQGLRLTDAEALMRGAGISGDSRKIRDYVQQNCDCHPLVVGALAGLINDYMRARGDFDTWLDARDGGGALDLADLDLTQSRNHILDAAIQALSPMSLKLLQTLALLQRGADYDLLMALNPHLPDESDKGDDPAAPTRKTAARNLNKTIQDLERRGLLQYEHTERRYDLHPVVRGVASGRMGNNEKQARGELVVSYFTSQSLGTWDDADSREDLAPGLQLVTTLMELGRFQEAVSTFSNGLVDTLIFNFQANVEVLALLRPLFPEGWDGETVAFSNSFRGPVLNDVAAAIVDIDAAQAQRLLERCLRLEIEKGYPTDICIALRNLTETYSRVGKAALRGRALSLALDLAKANGKDQDTFRSLSYLFEYSSDIGDDHRADNLWAELDPMGRDWRRFVYRPGDAETSYAFDRWRRGDLVEKQLAKAETLAREGRNRNGVRQLAYLRGQFHMERDETGKAVDSLVKAVRMAREVGSEDAGAEACLALARRRAGDTFDAQAEAERLDNKEDKAALAVAELWRELGESDRAIAAALRAHEWAVADGEPYVFRYELNRTRAVLEELGADLPEVPKYDPASDPPFEWEDDVRKLIEELRAKK